MDQPMLSFQATDTLTHRRSFSRINHHNHQSTRRLFCDLLLISSLGFALDVSASDIDRTAAGNHDTHGTTGVAVFDDPAMTPIGANSLSDKTIRVSVSSGGAQGNSSSDSDGNGGIAISSGGRFIVFSSNASNLVENDTNRFTADLFVHDRRTKTTELVNVSSKGEQADTGVFYSKSSISRDGRYIAFDSDATNLVENDTNGTLFGGYDVFVRDRANKTTERVSVSSTGRQGNDDSNFASISRNGRYVVFSSEASNLVADDTNGMADVFIHDRVNKSTDLVSLSSSGEQGNSTSFLADISADGRFIVFNSDATNLAPGNPHGALGIFIHDLANHTTELVITTSELYSGCWYPKVSAHGRFVVFESQASDLVPGDTNMADDIFVYDRVKLTTKRVSVSDSGKQAVCHNTSHCSLNPDISENGRYVSFASWADNLVEGDTSGMDIFVHDQQRKTTERISLGGYGEQGDGFSNDVSAISADGRIIAFESDSSNMVAGDTNYIDDTFVHILGDIKVTKRIDQRPELSAPGPRWVAGTAYTAEYAATNRSAQPLEQVQVYDRQIEPGTELSDQFICTLGWLKPGGTKSCSQMFSALDSQRNMAGVVKAIRRDGTSLVNAVSAYYYGEVNPVTEIGIEHFVKKGPNRWDGDTAPGPELPANEYFKSIFMIENTGNVDLYNVKVFQNPIFPDNAPRKLACTVGPLAVNETKRCAMGNKAKAGNNKVLGVAVGRNSIGTLARGIDPTYFRGQ